MSTREITLLSAIGIILMVAFFMGVIPIWSVWQQGLKGEAALARAEQERQILVQQATAERDAASLRAEAIGIVGQAAKDFPEYRYQEFLGSFSEALNSGKVQKLVFVPTEGQIPITEAGRTAGD